MLMKRNDSLLLVIDVQERLVTAMDSPREVINTCAKLVSIAQKLSIPFLITEQYPKGLGSTIIDVRQVAGDKAIYIDKLEFSCVRNAEIMERIKASNRSMASCVSTLVKPASFSF